MNASLRAWGFLVALIGVPACQKGSPVAPGATALAFTAPPIALGNIESIVPLGNMNPPNHTLPTDHVYVYHHLDLAHRSLPPFEVVAPAGGTVTLVRRGTDDTLVVQATARIAFRLDHILLDGSITQGMTLTAGQRLGTTSPDALAIDLGVTNDDITHAFVPPGRYTRESLHGDKPLQYFAEDLRSALYGLVAGANKDGRIDYEQPGRLSGNWFHESLSVAESPNLGSGPKHLAFARDVADGATPKISIGGTVAPAGVYAIADGDADPASVTPASGPVTFHVRGGNSGNVTGDLTVRMTGDNRLEASFGGATQVYVR